MRNKSKENWNWKWEKWQFFFVFVCAICWQNFYLNFPSPNNRTLLLFHFLFFSAMLYVFLIFPHLKICIFLNQFYVSENWKFKKNKSLLSFSYFFLNFLFRVYINCYLIYFNGTLFIVFLLSQQNYVCVCLFVCCLQKCVCVWNQWIDTNLLFCRYHQLSVDPLSVKCCKLLIYCFRLKYHQKYSIQLLFFLFIVYSVVIASVHIYKVMIK